MLISFQQSTVNLLTALSNKLTTQTAVWQVAELP